MVAEARRGSRKCAATRGSWRIAGFRRVSPTPRAAQATLRHAHELCRHALRLVIPQRSLAPSERTPKRAGLAEAAP